MNKYSVVIIDDEEACFQPLHAALSAYPELDVVGEANTASEGQSLIVNLRPNLVFLDVEMPGTSGLELLTGLSDRIDWSMQVVFYTAYEKYLLEALRASAFDYLLKPFSPDDFAGVMGRFFHKVQTAASVSRDWPQSLNQLQPGNRFFMVMTPTGYSKLLLSEVVYFDYQKLSKLWAAVLRDGSSCKLKRGTTADDIEGYSFDFVRINQSQILNLAYLVSIDVDDRCHLAPPFDTYRLTLSRVYSKAFHLRFDVI